MNNQMMFALQQIMKIQNPKEEAIRILNQASNQGNEVAKNMLKMVNENDVQGMNNFVNNYMKEKGINLSDLKQMFNR